MKPPPEKIISDEEIEEIRNLTSCSRQVARTLKVLQNEDRLLILCILMQEGEMSVSSIGQKLGIAQPSLSQQLTVLRNNKMVGTRRDGKSIYYFIDNQKARDLMHSLQNVFGHDAPENSEETEQLTTDIT